MRYVESFEVMLLMIICNATYIPCGVCVLLLKHIRTFFVYLIQLLPRSNVLFFSISQSIKNELTSTIKRHLTGTDFLISVTEESDSHSFEISVSETVLVRVTEDKQKNDKEAVVSWAFQDEHVGSIILKLVRESSAR